MNKLSPGSQQPASSSNNPTLNTPVSTAQQQGKGVLQTLRSLRQRNYRLYWFGQMISYTGTYMQTIGQAWLVLQLTHSALQLGLVGALQALPMLLFSLFGGVFADRWPRRQILIITQTAAMLQAFILWLLIATNTIQLWHLYILVVLLGLTNCLYRPASRAFVVELVGREDLPNAIALNSSLGQLTRIVGPGLGGIIIALSSVSTLFLLNAISFVAILGGLLLINRHQLHNQMLQRPTDSHLHSLHEGITYVWQTPAVLMVTLIVGLVLLFGSNFGVVLPLLATDVLHVGATGFGFLSAAMGIGALLSALWLAWGNQQPTIRNVLIATFIFGILELAFAVSHIYLLSIVLIASVCFAEEAFATKALTSLQTIVPDHLRGRATSVQAFFFDGSLPLGYVLMGWLAAFYGPSLALIIGALLSLLVVAAGWLWHKAAHSL